MKYFGYLVVILMRVRATCIEVMLTLKEFGLLGLAVVSRLLLARYGHEELSRRVEVVSPLTNWNNGAR